MMMQRPPDNPRLSYIPVPLLGSPALSLLRVGLCDQGPCSLDDQEVVPRALCSIAGSFFFFLFFRCPPAAMIFLSLSCSALELFPVWAARPSSSFALLRASRRNLHPL